MRMMLTSVLALCGILVLGGSAPAPARYDVEAVLSEINTRVDFALTKQGELESVEKIFTSARQQTGKFSVRVTRVGSDLYRVDGTALYIKTRYCHQHSHGEEAILTINGSYGFTIGSIEF